MKSAFGAFNGRLLCWGGLVAMAAWLAAVPPPDFGLYDFGGYLSSWCPGSSFPARLCYTISLLLFLAWP
jgi:hypothetical protein